VSGKSRVTLRRFAPLVAVVWFLLAALAVSPQVASHAQSDITRHAMVVWDAQSHASLLAPGVATPRTLTVSNTTSHSWTSLNVRISGGGRWLERQLTRCSSDWKDLGRGPVCRGLVTVVAPWARTGGSNNVLTGPAMQRGDVAHLRIDLRLAIDTPARVQGHSLPLKYEFVTA
jgi:hypothetical protein